jgi:hypothetical protein
VHSQYLARASGPWGPPFVHASPRRDWPNRGCRYAATLAIRAKCPTIARGHSDRAISLKWDSGDLRCVDSILPVKVINRERLQLITFRHRGFQGRYFVPSGNALLDLSTSLFLLQGSECRANWIPKATTRIWHGDTVRLCHLRADLRACAQVASEPSFRRRGLRTERETSFVRRFHHSPFLREVHEKEK